MASGGMRAEGACPADGDLVRILSGAAQPDELRHLETCDDCARLARGVASESSSGEFSKRLRPNVVLPGTLLAGRYHVRRPLGAGGMGEVHEAHDRLLGKVVAVKTLNARLAGNPEAVRRLKTEVALAHRVTHANVCRIFDLGIDHHVFPNGEPLVFLSMEYLPGSTLASHLRATSPLSERDAREILRQIALGLAAAHDVGVVHRDLKPENIMIVPETGSTVRAVITDFGLAGFEWAIASRDSGARNLKLSGTIRYAAPERLQGHPATPASDIYALGVIAQEMLRGQADTYAVGPVGTADWRRLVATLSATVPADRLPNGGALVRVLEGGRRPRHLGLVVGIALAGTFAAAAAWRLMPVSPVATARSARPAVEPTSERLAESPAPEAHESAAVVPEPESHERTADDGAPRSSHRRFRAPRGAGRAVDHAVTSAPLVGASAPALPGASSDLVRDVFSTGGRASHDLVDPFPSDPRPSSDVRDKHRLTP